MEPLPTVDGMIIKSHCLALTPCSLFATLESSSFVRNKDTRRFAYSTLRLLAPADKAPHHPVRVHNIKRLSCRFYDTDMLSVADQAAITSLLHAYGTVLSSRKIEDVLELYTHDGVIMAPGFAPAVGQAEIGRAYERIFNTIKLEIDFEIDEIVVMEDSVWAFARTTAHGTKHWLKKGSEESHHNQELFVCQKIEGRWKVARYSFSSMKPLM